jgi:hypothetical protein
MEGLELGRRLRGRPELFQVTTLHVVVAHQAPQFLQLGCRTPERSGATLDAGCEMQGGMGWLQESIAGPGFGPISRSRMLFAVSEARRPSYFYVGQRAIRPRLYFTAMTPLEAL